MAEATIRNLAAIQSQKQVNGSDVAQALRDVLAHVSSLNAQVAALQADVAALKK